jgi:hypothetical protein
MASRNPLILLSGVTSELPPGDSIVGSSVGILTAGSGLIGGGDLATNQRVDVSLAVVPSGLIFVGNRLGIDGSAQRTADTALASGNAALTLAASKGDVTLSGTQTLTNKTLTDPAIIGTILEDVFTITDGAAFEVDPGNGSVQLITLGASRTPKATNFAAGEAVTLMVDDGTAYTLTWSDATWGGSGVVWKTNAGAAPTLNTTGYTVITFWKVATQVYGARVGDA